MKCARWFGFSMFSFLMCFLFLQWLVSLTLPLSLPYNGSIVLLQNPHANYLLEVLCTPGKMGDQIKMPAVYNPCYPCWKDKTDAQMFSDLCTHVRICVYMHTYSYSYTHARRHAH